MSISRYGWLAAPLRIGFAVMLLLPLTQAALADVRFRTLFPKPNASYGGPDYNHPRIEIFGEITPGDAANVKALLPRAKAEFAESYFGRPILPRSVWARVLVVLDSEGGNVEEAIAVGRILRAANAKIQVPPGNICASACVLILASGATRQVWGTHGETDQPIRIGLHRPVFPAERFAALDPTKAREVYEKMSAIVRDYLSTMGMHESLYQAMIAVPSDDIHWMTADELSMTGLDGRNPAYDEWIEANFKSYCGEEWVEARNALSACTNRVYRPGMPDERLREACRAELSQREKAATARCP